MVLRFPNASTHDRADRTFLFPATGLLTIPMTNDYLFRALLQQSNKVLKGLICSLLHLSPEEVCTVEITNPIEPGTSINDKTFILDIKVILNNSTIINFPLFPEQPEFYATYQLLNVKNYSLYSDKLRLSVLDLTHIDLATEEDRFYQLDYWASLFKAATWEELNMLAQNNDYIKEASATIYKLSQEERIRMECEAREDYYRTQLGIQRMLNTQADKIEAQAAEIESQTAKIKSQTDEIKLQADEINRLHEWIRNHGHDPSNI